MTKIVVSRSAEGFHIWKGMTIRLYKNLLIGVGKGRVED